VGLFEERVAKSFDECQQTGEPDWLTGWIDASMELAEMSHGKDVTRGIYAEQVAVDILKLLKTWRSEVGCCGPTRALLGAFKRGEL
jgi:hypothetical protein